MSDNLQVLPLQNNHITRTFAVSGEGALTTISLLNRRTGKEFIVAGSDGARQSAEFALLWKGRWLRGFRVGDTGSDFVFVRSSQRTDPSGAQSLEIFLVTPEGDLEVRVICEIYPDLPATRKSLVVSNLGTEPGRLDGVVWEDIAISPSAHGDTQTVAGLEAQALDSIWRGNPGEWVASVSELNGHEGFLIINEAPGPVAALDINQERTPRARAFLSPNFGGLTIAPGASFATPATAILLYDTRSPEDGPSPRAREYLRRIVGAKGGLCPLAVHRASGPTPDQAGPGWLESKLLLLSSAALPIFLIEGGGMRRVGGFDVDPERLHGGLGHVARRIATKDISLGISLPLAEIDADCAVAQEHPEWLCQDAGGQREVYETAAGPRVMACLASGYSEHFLERIVELHQQTQIALLHLTGRIARLEGGGFSPCHDPEHRHGGPGAAGLEIGRAAIHLLREISERCPGLVVGVDEDLWAMPAPPDALTGAQAADFVRIGSVDDTPGHRGPLAARRIFYRRARYLPPECLTVGSLRLDGPNPVASVASALAGFPMLAGSLERVTSGQIDWLRSLVQWHTQLSRQINFHERFYLLHGSATVRPMRWDGYAKLSRDGEGFLAVFRNGAANMEQVFPIPGLDVTSRFRLESIVRDRVLGMYTAQELAKGATFETPHEDGADIIQIQRVDG